MTEIEKWFNDEYWPLYPKDLCGSNAKKGSRVKALSIIENKIKPNEILRELMLKNLNEQIIDARKDNEPSRWPHLTTYLNDKRYMDSVESTKEYVVHVDQCGKDGCSNDVHGAKFRYCVYHMPEPKTLVLESMRRVYKDFGMRRLDGESKRDHAIRLKDQYLKAIGLIL